MDVDLASLHKILKDPTRRNIVIHLSKKGPLAYVELMNLLEITNTGKFNYHLKILGNLIEKEDDGKYRLTERGQLASQLLQKFPDKTSEAKPLRMGDALLIGIVGFLLLFAFPGIYVSIGVIPGGFFLVTIYELFVPGAVMWWLTVRRTNSHDLYDLLKPPLIPLLLVAGWLLFMIIQGLSFPPQSSNGSFAQLTALGLLALGFFPFIGIMIAELRYRMFKSR